MAYIDYKKISSIPREKDGILVLDFSDTSSFSVFEVADLFVYLALFPFDGNTYRVEGENDVVDYLFHIQFFHYFEKVKGLVTTSNSFPQEETEGMMLRVYRRKPSFYAGNDAIIDILNSVGIAEDKILLITSSLGEAIDNAFSHNLGKWDSAIGPLVVFLLSNNSRERKIYFSVCDFGVGFLETLKGNYPDLQTEEEAISCALRPNVTGRANKKGGNGLDFLKQNVFNGFKGDLYIRSMNTLFSVGVKRAEESSSLKGSGVFFSLVY